MAKKLVSYYDEVMEFAILLIIFSGAWVVFSGIPLVAMLQDTGFLIYFGGIIALVTIGFAILLIWAFNPKFEFYTKQKRLTFSAQKGVDQ